MANFVLLTLCSLCYVFVVFASKNTVPVVVWSSSIEDLPVSLAGHRVNGDDFTASLMNLIKDPHQNIIAFLQDKLSLDDITQNADVYSEENSGGLFHNLKNLMENHASFHFPHVDNPASSLDALKSKFQGKVHDLHEPFSIKDLSLNSDGGNLVIAHLPSTDGNEAHQQKTLSQIDGILQGVTKDMKSLGKPYSAIYTGQRSSKNELPNERLYLGRHLLDVEDNIQNQIFINIDNCVYFFVTNSTLITFDKDNKKIAYALGNDTTSSGTCNTTKSNSFSLTVTYKVPPSELESCKFNIQYVLDKFKMWSIKYWNVTYKLQSEDEKKFPLKTQELLAPNNYSYHCTKSVLQSITAADKSRIQVVLDDFQTQAFNVTNNTFGPVNDCTGFFTIPIWSGIISGIVLLLVLVFGLHMITDINTPDRFDDPKGKTITVNVSE